MEPADTTAKRPLSGPVIDDPTAKRRRAGLTDEEQRELGLTDDQVGLLALDANGVKKRRVPEVQRWVVAALIAGGLEGSIENENRGIGKVLKILRDNEVTGAALVNLTLEKLIADGIARGPAEVLAARIDRLRAPPVSARRLQVEDMTIDTATADLVLPADCSALKKIAGPGQRILICRERALDGMGRYVDGVINQRTDDEFMSPSGKGRRICATVGASGMGKSALLETFAIAQNKMPGRSALFVTYNTVRPVPDMFCRNVDKEFCIAGALLHAAGVEKEQLLELARATTASQAVAVIRRQRGMAEHQVLVVCVDELLQVNSFDTIATLLSGYMLLQDEQKGKLAVVLSAFAEKQIEGWTSRSGRQLFPIFLGPLPHAEAKRALLEELASEGGTLASWLHEDFADKVVSVVATHPRSLFDFLPRRVKLSPQQHSLQALVAAIFASVHRLEDSLFCAPRRFLELLHSRVRLYEQHDELIQQGLQTQDSTTGDWLLVPFLVRAFAYSEGEADTAEPSADRQLLRSALDADMLVTAETRVRAEVVVQNFEGMVRLARGSGKLDQLFIGAKVGSLLRHTVYFFFPASRPAELVKRVDGFDKSRAESLELLRNGHVVVSRMSKEPGIEHMSPLFNEDHTLVALLVTQIKAGTSVPRLLYRSGEKVPAAKVCAELCKRATDVGKKVTGGASGIDVIPVVMLNSGCALSGSRKAVLLGPDELKRWLCPLMPLQMIEEAHEVDVQDSLDHDPDAGETTAV